MNERMKIGLVAVGIQHAWERLKECKVLRSGYPITREYLGRPCSRGEIINSGS
jgi:gamma-glutamylcysteine synthetase